MILAIETSTTTASLALWDPDRRELIDETVFTSDRAHNSVIFDPLEKLLVGNRSELQGIVVGLGPGSYSGVRVGIAVANGLSMALGIPVIGSSSLEAWESEVDDFVVIGDARRRTYFLAEVTNRELQNDPELLTEEEIADHLDRSSLLGTEVHTADQSVSEKFSAVRLSFPSAARLAALNSGGGIAGWEVGSVLEPHYLRAPYITVPSNRSTG